MKINKGFLAKLKSKYINMTNEDKMHFYLVILIFILAIFIRVWEFTNIPFGVNQDEAMAAVDGKALADYGTDRLGMFMPVHLTAWGYGQMSSLLSYLIAPFTKLFGLNLLSTRLPLLLISLFSLYIVYRFALKCGNKKIALIALFIAAISPWHIMQSRWSLDCNLFPHFLLFGCYSLYLGLNKSKYLYFSMIWFALSMYCYGIAIYTVPAFLLIAVIILLIRKQVNWKQVLICLAIYLVLASPFILCMAINFFKLDTISLPFMTIPFFKDSLRMNDILFFSPNIPQQLLSNLKSFFDIAILQKPDELPWNSINGYGLFYWLSIPFILIGLFNIIRTCKRNKGMLLILIFTITALIAGISTNNVNINRLNIICYPWLFACTLGIYYATKRFKYTVAVVMVAFTVYFGFFVNSYFTDHREILALNYYEGFAQSMEYAKTLNCDKYYITDYVQLDGFPQVSEVLTLFYDEIDAKYYQSPEFSKKYSFVDYANFNSNPKKGAVYIVNNDELPYLNMDKYELMKSFNRFSVLLKK